MRSIEIMSTRQENGNKREILAALCLFLVPISVIIPLYTFEILQSVELAYYIIYSVYIAGSFFIMKHYQREWFEIGITKKNLSESLILGIGFVVGFIIAQTIHSELHLSSELTPTVVIKQLVFCFAFSGPGQEILFRGVVLFSVARQYGWETGIIINSILFGLIHVTKGVQYVIATAIIGLFYSYVAYRTKNIVGPIVGHGFSNFILGFILVA